MESRKWEEMEMDCLVNVFERLSLEDLILGVPFVCKSWYEASTNPSCWKVIDFLQLDLHPDSDFIERFKQEYRVDNFSFTSFLKFTVNLSRRSAVEIILPSLDATLLLLEDLTYISNEFPALETLFLPYMFTQFENQIPEYLSKWKKFEQLWTQGKPISFQDTLKIFIELTTSGLLGSTETLAITTMLPKIKHLFLSKSYMSKEGLLIILEGCKEQEILDVKYSRGFRVNDETLNIFKVYAGILKMASHFIT